MVKLTEDMVVARSKGSDLHNIKKLNCWGSELTNVSVVRKLPNVEVLSLSVNQISTLEDFQSCSNLQELYIRKNQIADINEVLYLRNIPKLKSLWLADNPCANFEQYRLTVLRTLPHLQKLDNIPVENEEVQQALLCGLTLPLPDSNFRCPESTEMVRSVSAGESLRSESRCGSGGSISDSSPSLPCSQPAADVTVQNNRNSTYNNQSLEEGFEYTSQNLYDEDEEQPPLRRTSYTAPAQEPEPFERRPVSQNYSVQNRGSRYYEHPSQVYDDYREDGRISSTSSHQYASTCNSNQRRQSFGSARSQQQVQSPPRRPSQAATPSDPELLADTRPYSRASTEYSVDTRNANHVGREESYTPSRYNNKDLPPPSVICNSSTNAHHQVIENNNNMVRKSFHRRTSRDQYRDQSWQNDGDNVGGREKVFNNGQAGDLYRQRENYAGRPSQDFRSPPEGRHFGPRPSSMGEVLQQQYDDTYRRVNQQIETATRVGGANEKPSPTRPYPMRPKTRNANVLSAVLCLIKELDYSSLEVVEMAIRCRMEELED